jgi:hypothetical protein
MTTPFNLASFADKVSSTGTARYTLSATVYGGDKAIFGFGDAGGLTNITNLVSNTGVVSSNTTGVGTSREAPAAGYSLT